MRLSTRSGDPGYHRHARNIRVFLDGVEQRSVFTADEEQGLIVRAVLNENGRIRLNAPRDAVDMDTVRGVVRIEIPDGHPLKRAKGAA